MSERPPWPPKVKGSPWVTLRKIGFVVLCAGGVAILVANAALELVRHTSPLEPEGE